jgi:hypothetical protein
LFKKNENKWLSILIVLLVAGCNNVSKDNAPPVEKADKRKLGFGSIAGEDFLTFGGPRKNTGPSNNLSVNQYLWQASLQTLEFLPLASIDSSGGVIVTDWYSTSTAPNEKVKVCVYILSNILRADAIKVIVYKQIRAANGNWIQAASCAQTATDLENIILTKARQLKIQDKKEK